MLHHCDNPPCVRPDHLFEGTHADNVADCIEKGRRRRGKPNPVKGERHYNAKLTDKQVDILRVMYATGDYTYVQLGALFKISDVHAGRIVRHMFRYTHSPDARL